MAVGLVALILSNRMEVLKWWLQSSGRYLATRKVRHAHGHRPARVEWQMPGAFVSDESFGLRGLRWFEPRSCLRLKIRIRRNGYGPCRG